MLVSLSWLKKYVQVPDDTDALVHDLTMAGLNVERCIQSGLNDPAVVIGHVLSVADHPNADKLRVCRVRVGPEAEDLREIVCGAPNVAEGQRVIVALPGAKLSENLKIRRAKIRGVQSDGMICSERELGLGGDAAGIMVVDAELEAGVRISDTLLPPDVTLDIEITPNRPDLLSHVGVAREVSAIYSVPVSLPVLDRGDDAHAKMDFEVRIDSPEDCRRYVGRRVSGVVVGPSPAWLVNALEAVGLTSINNVVDVSNYVLMELGQPIHTFDCKRLRGSEIIVRRAEKGERLLTLDENTHTLDENVLVIADVRGAVALAGVIGGEESAVHADTTEVLIESAHFNPVLVRRASKKLGIGTDASYRFERGCDREACRWAADRAAGLIQEVAGGKIGGVVDEYPGTWTPQSLTIRTSATKRILGAQLSTGEIEDYLSRLSFQVSSKSDDALTVQVPSHRLDLFEEIDLIEEVARLYGYHRIGVGWSFRCTTHAAPDPFDRFIERLSEHLTARGLTEVVTSSFTDGRELGDFGWAADDPRSSPIAIRNPLNVNHRYMQTSLLPGMLDIIRRNIDHGTPRLRLYGVGRVYLSPRGTEQLPEERTMLGIALSGVDERDFWYNWSKAPDLFAIKEEIEVLLGTLRVDGRRELAYAFDDASGHFEYSFKNEGVIEGGILPDAVAARFDFEQPVWFATIDLERLYERSARRPRVEPLVEFPSSKRDLSLVAGPRASFARIEKSLVKAAGRLLESLQVFDVYVGDQIAGDQTAYGVRLQFRSREGTLTDGEVDRVIDKILTTLKNDLGVELRK